MDEKMAVLRAAKKAKEESNALRVQLFADGADPETMEDCDVMLQCMKRLDEGWSKAKVTEVSGRVYRTLVNYYDVWKTCSNLDPTRYSADAVQKSREERFKFHCNTMKPGRQFCQPLTRLEIKESVADIVSSGQCQLLGTQVDAYTNAILPNLAKEHEKKGFNVLAGAAHIFQKSKSAIVRHIHQLIPVHKENVKKHVQSRTDARNNPVGAFSFIALFPQLVRNVHISNIVCIDTVSTELFGEANKGAWITQEVADDLSARRQAPKASDSGGQYRSFKLSLAMALGPEALVNACGIVADHEIKSIEKINIAPNIDIIFSPYCAKDESGNANTEPREADSLSKRLADCIYGSHMPRIIQRRNRMEEWARANGSINPDVFSIVRILQDGDSGALKKIMETFALSERQKYLLFGKLPNAQTNNIQVNDMAVTHCIIHSASIGYSSSSFKSMNEARVQHAMALYPGLTAALAKLESYAGISRNGKLSYRYAIAYLPSLLARAVTPPIVEDAFRVAGYHPYDPAKMMHNMWTTFQKLTEAEAREALRIAEGPLREIGEQRGVIWPKEILRCIQESPILDPVVQLPDIPDDFEMRRWNMQSTMDLSHNQVQALHDERIAAAALAQRAQAIANDETNEVQRRTMLRYRECEESHVVDEATQKRTHLCKCGGKWTNGVTGFKGHEDAKKHQKKFPPEAWEALYAAHPAEQLVEQPQLPVQQAAAEENAS